MRASSCKSSSLSRRQRASKISPVTRSFALPERPRMTAPFSFPRISTVASLAQRPCRAEARTEDRIMSLSDSARQGEITVAKYLVQQLVENGIDMFFGVPGDFRRVNIWNFVREVPSKHK